PGPLSQLREGRAARHRRDDRRRQPPPELFGDLVGDGLRPLAVVAAQIDVHDPPAEPVRHLGAQPVHIVVRPPYPNEAGAVHARADHFSRLELVGDEDPRLEPRPCRVRRDGVREVAGRRATEGIEPEGGGRVDGAGREGLAVWERACRVIHGVEGPETLLADRGRGGGALGPAAAATERPGGERRGSDGRRHVSLNKKTPATTAAGGRFLAPCLTWRQYAANHHGWSIVLTNNSR